MALATEEARRYDILINQIAALTNLVMNLDEKFTKMDNDQTALRNRVALLEKPCFSRTASPASPSTSANTIREWMDCGISTFSASKKRQNSRTPSPIETRNSFELLTDSDDETDRRTTQAKKKFAKTSPTDEIPSKVNTDVSESESAKATQDTEKPTEKRRRRRRRGKTPPETATPAQSYKDTARAPKSWAQIAASGAASGSTSGAASGSTSGAASGSTSGPTSGLVSGATSGPTSGPTSGAEDATTIMDTSNIVPVASTSGLKTPGTAPLVFNFGEKPPTKPAAVAEPVLSKAGPTEAKSRIPPVVLRDASKWTTLTDHFRRSRINFSKAKTCPDGVRIQPSSIADFRAMTKHLEAQKIAFYTFTAPENRTMRVVLRNMSTGVSSQDILEDLHEQGFEPIACSRMHSNKKALPLVLVELPLNSERIWKIRRVCNLSVKAEKPRKSNVVAQCHQCQRFFHSSKNCCTPARCVKCGAPHKTENCKKDRSLPAKCANCEGSHTANYRGCPAFPKQKFAKDAKKPVPKQRFNSAAPAAAPVRAAAPAPAPKPKSAPRTARQEADFSAKKAQTIQAIAAAKDEKSLAIAMANFVATYFN